MRSGGLGLGVIAARIPITQIIGKDENYIRELGLCLCAKRQAGSSGGKKGAAVHRISSEVSVAIVVSDCGCPAGQPSSIARGA